MLYWLPATGASAARLYWESIHQVNEWISGTAGPPVDVPTGCMLFPKELQRPSRRWAEKRFTNILHWGEPDRGGHFAAPRTARDLRRRGPDVLPSDPLRPRRQSCSDWRRVGREAHPIRRNPAKGATTSRDQTTREVRVCHRPHTRTLPRHYWDRSTVIVVDIHTNQGIGAIRLKGATEARPFDILTKVRAGSAFPLRPATSERAVGPQLQLCDPPDMEPVLSVTMG